MSIRQLIRDAWCRVRYPQLSASFAVPSHLTHDERVALYSLAQSPGIESIVEIGSYLGASAAALAAGLRDASNDAARVYCIDTWHNDAMSDGQRDTMASFLENTSVFGASIVVKRGWSTDVAASIAESAGQIDLLFIDGDHSHPGCLADWKTYAPLLKPGAWVAFHDIGWAEGVQQVVREHVAPLAHSADTLPNLWWGRMK